MLRIDVNEDERIMTKVCKAFSRELEVVDIEDERISRELNLDLFVSIRNIKNKTDFVNFINSIEDANETIYELERMMITLNKLNRNNWYSSTPLGIAYDFSTSVGFIRDGLVFGSWDFIGYIMLIQKTLKVLLDLRRDVVRCNRSFEELLEIGFIDMRMVRQYLGLMQRSNILIKFKVPPKDLYLVLDREGMLANKYYINCEVCGTKKLIEYETIIYTSSINTNICNKCSKNKSVCKSSGRIIKPHHITVRDFDGVHILNEYQAMKRYDFTPPQRKLVPQYHNKDLLFGVEIEVGGDTDTLNDNDFYRVNYDEIENESLNRYIRSVISRTTPKNRHAFWCVYDGSASTTLEFVTKPMTYQSLIKNDIIKNLFRTLSEDGFYMNNEDGTTGMHIHVSRSALKNEHKLAQLFQKFVPTFQSMFNRGDITSGYAQRYCQFLDVGYTNDILEMYRSCGKYSALNIKDKTIEFRIFGGTLEHKRMVAYVQFIKILVELSESKKRVEDISIEDFKKIARYYKEFMYYGKELMSNVRVLNGKDFHSVSGSVNDHSVDAPRYAESIFTFELNF